MNSAPPEVDGATVLFYALMDSHQLRSGSLQDRVKALAICQYDDTTFYLFGCDEQWNCVTDTWHQTLADAQAQAEYQHSVVSRYWQKPDAA